MIKQSLNIVAALIIYLVFCNCKSNAQTPETFSFEGGYRYGSLSETDGFSKIPDYQSCCDHVFTSEGISDGAYLKLNAGFTDLWGIALEFGFSRNVSQLNAYEPVVISVGDTTDFLGSFNHHIEVKFNEISILPTLIYNYSVDISFRAKVGIVIISSNSFSGLERIVYPTDRGVFKETGTRVRNEKQGTITDMSAAIPIIGAGADYFLPLVKNRKFGFIISFDLIYNLGSYLNDSDWSAYSLGLGVGFCYKL